MVARYGSLGLNLPKLGLPLCVLAMLLTRPATGQFQFSTRFELSEAVYLQELDNAAHTRLAHLKNYLAAKKWDEALATLRLLSEASGSQLVDQGNRRFVSIATYCDQQLCQLPAEALASHRLTIDPQAKEWYEAGVGSRDEEPLLRIVDQAFVSSWGDDALLALGELALERGDSDSARSYWRMILPAEERVSAGGPPETTATSLTYPDTDIGGADVNARLVLTSILAGDASRAESELADFKRRHGAAKGVLAGRKTVLAQWLESMLTERQSWPAEDPSPNWTTFAGSMERDRVAADSVDVGAKQWEAPLAEVTGNELIVGSSPFARRMASVQPLARRQQRLLSYYPLVIDGLVLFNTSDEIYAYDLKTGSPAWGTDNPVVFRDAAPTPRTRLGFNNATHGYPRYSMTADQGRLYARLGSPLTTTVGDAISSERQSYLVCVDLAAQGRLLWKVGPELEKFAFEGAPICDGDNLYVALRRSDVRPQAHVACYDAETGKRRWIKEICSAETLSRGQYDETTSNLLTLHGDAIYVNTNLGAVARLSKRDGHIDWVKVYRERQVGDAQQLQPYVHRDLTPCVFHRGRIYVAPADNERIYALNADTGELIWDTRYAPDVVHLLGIGGDNLLASGDRLYWINCDSGKLIRYWPDGNMPKGYGRGILAGRLVYWPTREAILVFDQQSGKLERNIDLRGKDELATAGNLLAAEGMLLVASTNRLVAYGQYSRVASGPEPQEQ